MIIGFNAFGDKAGFDVYNIVNNFSRFELSNVIADEINMREKTDIDIYDSTKSEWQYDNLLLALFKENLEGGNVSLNGMPINYLRLKKRKKETLTWDNIVDIPFDTDTVNYSYIDKYIESLQEYEYAIQPLGAGGITGNQIISSIEADFEGVWICSKDKQYQLLYNLNLGDYETVMPTSVIETIGNQYPIVQVNGIVKYRKGNIKCRLISDTTINQGKTDRQQEKLNRQNIMDFLTDRRPKVFKDSSGEHMMIMLFDPSVSPINELSQQIYDLSVSFVEIGGTDANSLKNNGLL